MPLADFDAATNADVSQTLAVLTDARLLTVGEGSVEVAHEALLREWPRLSDWLEEDREGRRLRRHLADSAREWAAAGRDAGELYRGARLSAALDWTTDHTLELNELERQFVAESRATTERESDRQRRTNRRLRVLLAAAAGALVIAIGAGGVALLQRGEAERAAAEAQAQRSEADAQRAAAEQAAITADAQRLGAQALVATDLDRSLLLARQGYALDDSEATRANLLAAVTRSPGAIGVWRPLPGRLLDALATPDGGALVVNNNDGRAAIVDTRTMETRFVYARREGESFVGPLGDDTLVVYRDGPRRVGLLDLVDGTERGEIRFAGDVGGVFVAPDGATYAATDPSGDWLEIRDASDHSVLRRLSPPTGMTFLDIWLFTDQHVMGVLRAGPLPDPIDEAFEQPATLAWYPPGSTTPVVMLPVPAVTDRWALSRDFRWAAIANDPEPGSVTVYDLATGEGRPLGGRHSAAVQGLAFSPDGRLVGTGGDDRLMMIWSTEDGHLIETYAGHDGRVFDPAFSELDGRLTAFTPSLDGTLMGWDVSGERRLGRPFTAGSGNEVEFVDDTPVFEAFPTAAVSPAGDLLAVSQAGGVAIDDPVGGAAVEELTVGGSGFVGDVAWSPLGDRVAVAGSGEAIVQLWDPTRWTRVGGPLEGPSEQRPARTDEIDLTDPSEDEERINLSRTLAFSPDGALIAAGADDGRIWIWDVATGALRGDPIEVGWPVFDLAFDPTGARIAAAYNETSTVEPWAGRAGVWTVDDRRLMFDVSVDDQFGRAGAVAFSPDGRVLATGGGLGDVRSWDATTGEELGRRVQAAAGWVFSIAWHPTRPMIVTAATDGTIRLIDTERRIQTGVLPGEDNVPATAFFTRDGSRVLAVYSTGRAYDWMIEPVRWAEQACRVAGRTLTREEWDQFLPDRPYEPACG